MCRILACGPQRPHYFASHFWGEPVRDFVACVAQHTRDRAYGGGKFARYSWNRLCSRGNPVFNTEANNEFGLHPLIQPYPRGKGFFPDGDNEREVENVYKGHRIGKNIYR